MLVRFEERGVTKAEQQCGPENCPQRDSKQSLDEIIIDLKYTSIRDGETWEKKKALQNSV